MKKPLVEIRPISLFPTQNGCAMFLSGGGKVVLIYIDPSIGMSMNDILSGEKPQRPQTHDFFQQFVDAIGGKMTKAVILKEEQEVFYSIAEFQVVNEVMHRKVVQIECRPSDSISMAIRAEIPIFCDADVWAKQKDRSDMLADLRSEFENHERNE